MAKNRLNFEAHLSRHPHRISGGYASHLTPGPIVPQYFDILQPGDTIYFEPSMFVRMQDVVTAFFGEVDVHLDAFFVPLQMLYTPFGSIFMRTDDIMTSTLSDLQDLSQNDRFPLFDPKDAVTSRGNGLNLSTRRYLGADSKGKEFARLLDALDMNPFILFTQENCEASGFEFDQSSSIDTVVCQSPMITPWIPCAYQAIYQKYYRNEEFERFDVRNYNFDRYYDQVTAGTTFTDPEILQLRYHQRLSDYFTDLRVSPIASAVNNLNNSGNGQFPDNGDILDELFYKVNSFLCPADTNFGGQGYLNGISVGEPDSFNALSTTSNSVKEYEDGNYSYLNTANIRSLFALDKFLRVWGRAGKTYDDQILAHFGVKIPHDVKHDITHIKHWQASLTADPIYSTANIPLGRTVGTDEPVLVSSLGQVGAQSQCTVGGSSEKFRAPVHGVFMIVAYALTKPIYEGTFSKLHLLTNRLSFPVPEFDKLGAQPLYAFEFARYGLQSSEIDSRVGWQNRYEQFKRKYNRCSFTYSVANLNYHVAGVSNVFAPWILSRQAFPDYRRNQLITGLDLFEPVGALDNVMVTSYDGNMYANYWSIPHLMFQTDPLITNFYANAKKVSWMSETGEPEL